MKYSQCAWYLLPALAAAQTYPPTAFGLTDPDGILSLQSNPAGLASLRKEEVAAEIGANQPMGQDLVHLGTSGFGVGWDRSKRGGMLEYSNLRVGFGAEAAPGLMVGATGIRQSIDGQATGWSVDLGLLLQPDPHLSFGWLMPNLRGRDGTRSTGHKLGAALRPRGVPEVEVGLETYLGGPAWMRTAWDFPQYEAALRLRPVPWVWLDTRVDPQALPHFGLGVTVQIDPHLGLRSRSVPAQTGPEFHSAGLRLSAESFPAATSNSPVLLYRIGGDLTEIGRPGWFGRSGGGLSKLREDFRQMAGIPGLRKVVLHLGRTKVNPTAAGILHREILALRARGLEVLAWTQDLDYGTLYAISACDRIAMSPEGSVHVRGLGLDLLYFGKLLSSHGIKVQVAKTGAWKSAMETWQSDHMSGPAKENMEAWLHDLDSTMMAGIVGGRKLDPVRFLQALDSASLMPRRARGDRLVDTLLLEQDLKSWAGAEKGWSRAALAGEHLQAWGAQRRVVVVPIQGQIVDHAGESGMTPWSASLPADRVAGVLDQLRDDPRVAAVVLRIGSPGGAVSGSERLRRSVEKLAAKKTVASSIGSTCASGAYLLALPSGRLFSEPEAVVGSIGAFAAKVSVGGLLDSLGVGVERLRTARHAGAASPYGALDTFELARLSEFVEDAHVAFGEQVRKWRKLDSARFDKVDGGRVFAGSRALDLGLVDELGGLEEAVAWARSQAGATAAGEIEWIDPVPSSNWGSVSRLIEASASGTGDWERFQSLILPHARTAVWAQAPWEPLWP